MGKPPVARFEGLAARFALRRARSVLASAVFVERPAPSNPTHVANSASNRVSAGKTADMGWAFPFTPAVESHPDSLKTFPELLQNFRPSVSGFHSSVPVRSQISVFVDLPPNDACRRDDVAVFGVHELDDFEIQKRETTLSANLVDSLAARFRLG